MRPPAPADPTERFGDRAQDYARARPGYPSALVPRVLKALDLDTSARVVDIGCGTGLSSVPFLQAGMAVAGIEPNAAMRAHAASLARDYPTFTVHDGRSEATGLPDASADLLIAAQAFHWFDVAQARREALRILRRPARAALIWNDRDTAAGPFARGYEELVLQFSPDYLEVKHQHDRLDRVAAFFGDQAWQTLLLDHGDDLDFETLAARMRSASYLPGPGAAGHDAMMAALRALFEQTATDGRVHMPFRTRILLGVLASASPGTDGSRPS